MANESNKVGSNISRAGTSRGLGRSVMWWILGAFAVIVLLITMFPTW